MAVDVTGLINTAAAQGVPLDLLDIVAADTASYAHALVLARPDQHVTWRGNTGPADPDALVARMSGRWSEARQQAGRAVPF